MTSTRIGCGHSDSGRAPEHSASAGPNPDEAIKSAQKTVNELQHSLSIANDRLSNAVKAAAEKKEAEQREQSRRDSAELEEFRNWKEAKAKESEAESKETARQNKFNEWLQNTG